MTKKPSAEYGFLFHGKRYGYGSRNHYQCEFCDLRATWNAVIQDNSRYALVCDDHFLEHCQQPSAVRFQEPLPGETYTLKTNQELMREVSDLEARYRARNIRGQRFDGWTTG